MVKLFIDGGCSGNGQRDLSKRKMVSVVSDHLGNVIIEEESVGGSNNIAEFIALKRSLEHAVHSQLKEVEIITDSRNNIAWFKGKKIGKKVNDFERTNKIKSEIDILKQKLNVNIVWKPREENLAGHYIESRYSL